MPSPVPSIPSIEASPGADLRSGIVVSELEVPLGDALIAHPRVPAEFMERIPGVIDTIDRVIRRGWFGHGMFPDLWPPDLLPSLCLAMNENAGKRLTGRIHPGVPRLKAMFA